MRATLPPVTEGRILIDIRGVCYLSYLSDETIRKLMNEGRFPRGFKLGTAPNSPRRWVRSEIVAFLERGLDMAQAEEVAHGS
jgi:predicted DNA-binding transcriptional regulator AlpA